MAAQLAPGAPLGMVVGLTTLMFVLGVMFSLAYPALLLFFMTRSNVIEACQPQPPAAPG
jgi:hypothetical protein